MQSGKLEVGCLRTLPCAAGSLRIVMILTLPRAVGNTRGRMFTYPTLHTWVHYGWDYSSALCSCFSWECGAVTIHSAGRCTKGRTITLPIAVFVVLFCFFYPGDSTI